MHEIAGAALGVSAGVAVALGESAMDAVGEAQEQAAVEEGQGQLDVGELVDAGGRVALPLPQAVSRLATSSGTTRRWIKVS